MMGRRKAVNARNDRQEATDDVGTALRPFAGADANASVASQNIDLLPQTAPASVKPVVASVVRAQTEPGGEEAHDDKT